MKDIGVAESTSTGIEVMKLGREVSEIHILTARFTLVRSSINACECFEQIGTEALSAHVLRSTVLSRRPRTLAIVV